jgi:hypothetical protein
MTTKPSSPPEQSQSEPKLSEEQRAFLVFQVAEAAKKKVSSWAKWMLGFGVVILALFGIQYQISLSSVDDKVETVVTDRLERILKEKSGDVDRLSQKMMDKHIESLTLTLTESSKIIQSLRTESAEEHKKVRKELTDIETEAAKLQAKAKALQELLDIKDIGEFGNKVRRIKDLADDIGATNLVGLTLQIAKLGKSLEERRIAADLSARTVDSRINGLEYSPPSHFLSASQIIEWLLPRLESGDSVRHLLLIFAKDDQRTWIVTTSQGRLFAVLNNTDKTPTKPLVDARVSDVTQVEHRITTVGIQSVGEFLGTSRFAAHLRKGHDDGQNLLVIADVCPGGANRQRHSVAIDHHRVFRAWFPAIHGTGSRGFASAKGPHNHAVDDHHILLQGISLPQQRE